MIYGRKGSEVELTHWIMFHVINYVKENHILSCCIIHIMLVSMSFL
jgi:hypothetical protein